MNSDAPTNYNVQRTFYEFFAGGGMARCGLGAGWRCLFANDHDVVKAGAYRDNWQGDELLLADINSVSAAQLPGVADLAWASFPCQDLSLAGKYVGLGAQQAASQTRSGAFWPFWRLIDELAAERRKPRVVALENVYGVLTANRGRDFASIAAAFAQSGYRFGAVVIDAKHFVPQSRPRVFIVGVREDVHIPDELVCAQPMLPWHVAALQLAQQLLPSEMRAQWVWWKLPLPGARATHFADVIEDDPQGVAWDSTSETQRLLDMMSDVNLHKIAQARQAGERQVGGVYRRTRRDASGAKVQRAEARFDGVAGCLRTPAGGSSRQRVVVVEREHVRSRLLSPREAARLMGLPDDYRLPTNYNDAYRLCGDGVAPPAVRHLARHLLNPLIDANPN